MSVKINFDILRKTPFPFLSIAACLLLTTSFSFGQFTISRSITNSTCSYDSSGSISLSVTGGAAPYTFSWSHTAAASASVTGLHPGTYSVTVTDNLGADSSLACLVGPSPMVNDTTGNIERPFCNDNGSIVLNVTGGTGSYQYAWSNGTSTVWAVLLGAGDHFVTVTDVNSCTATFKFSLTEIECFISPEPYFTPNGDGHNDTWFIANSQYFEDARVIIFDRWGTKVYDRKGKYESWDGKSYLGVPVPDAVYYYFFYQDKDDKQKASKYGSVTLLR
ncbi:MAG: gliding motility-associated C-terminal domain-containing protein [Phycisphaeraceae bacterium]|nr:gliding motility-associated C-terminal domain-containing protein [Phycisphaeraceae bacterium]